MSERLVADRYLKHPSGLWLEDGAPLDAGTVMHVDNNLSRLSYESPRHFVTDVGPQRFGAKGAAPSTGIGNEGTPETPAAIAARPTWQKISWGRLTCAKYGPFPAIFDRTLTTGQRGCRAVRVKVRVVSAAGTLQLAAALTDGTRPYLAGNDVYARTGTATNWWTTVSAGAATVTFDLEPGAPATHPGWQRRELVTQAGTRGRTVSIVPLYLFVGWYSTNNGDYVETLSAYESREI